MRVAVRCGAEVVATHQTVSPWLGTQVHRESGSTWGTVPTAGEWQADPLDYYANR